MATLAFDGTDDYVRFTPISAELANLPNGAATIAMLIRWGDDAYGCELRNSAETNWYHGMNRSSANRLNDDDGLVGTGSTATTLTTQTASADNYQISVVDWPSGGAALERFHWSATIGSAESWTHSDSTGNNGGNRAGPGTTGRLYLGADRSSATANNLLGEIALIGVWAGVRFSDANVEALWVNKKTSDWYNHSAGTPTCLIEFTSTAPEDIGAFPSTLDTVNGAVATGANPTGWTFDGQGAVQGPAIRVVQSNLRW
jgi:hypothetical protein